MTISSVTVKNSYSGNGTLDTFNYTFKIFADADIQVIIRDATATETVKTLTTHYTVTGAGSASGGTIVFTAGNIPTATETVVIRRASPQTQAIDYMNSSHGYISYAVFCLKKKTTSTPTPHITSITITLVPGCRSLRCLQVTQ